MRKIITIALSVYSGVVCAQAVQETKLQAAMLFNMIKYIKWPDEGGDEKFVIGVLGSSEMYDALKTGYEGRPKGAKKFVILNLSTIADVTSCSVVFIGKDKSREFESVKNTLSGKNVLTVTYKEDLGRKGSCINFILIDGKVRFELNRAMFSAYNLKVASELMNMATVI